MPQEVIEKASSDPSRRFDAYLKRLGAKASSDFKLLILAIEGHFVLGERISLKNSDVESWKVSKGLQRLQINVDKGTSGLFRFAKFMATQPIYSDPAIWKEIGYSGPWVSIDQNLQPIKEKKSRLYETEFSASSPLKLDIVNIPNMDTIVIKGKMVGGSATINHALCFELPEPIRSEWERRFGFDISANELNQHYAVLKKELSVSPVPLSQINRNNAMLALGSEALGWHEHSGAAERNVVECRGCGYCDTGCRYNRKQTPLLVHLPNAARHGARIVPNCEVMKIEFKKNKQGSHSHAVQAVIARGSFQGEEREVKIPTSLVVLAGGALDSPRILQRSGVGPTEWFNPFGFSKTAHNPNVGRHLTTHAPSAIYGIFDHATFPNTGGPPMSYYVGEFSPSNPNCDIPEPTGPSRTKNYFKFEGTFNLPVSHAQLTPFGHPTEIQERADRIFGESSSLSREELQTRTKSSSTLSPSLDDESTTTVHKNQWISQEWIYSHWNLMKRYNSSARMTLIFRDSPNGMVKPNSFTYRLQDEDKEQYLRGLKAAAQIYFAAGARQVYFAFQEPLIIDRKESPDATQKEIDRLLTMKVLSHHRVFLATAHPMGGCRMGSNAKESVVDPNGESWNIENLYITDASIFPTSTTANPTLTICALSRAIAHRLLQKRGLPTT